MALHRPSSAEEADMRGHIQQQGSKGWRIKAYLGRDADGRKRYTQRPVAGTRADAVRELSRLLVEVDEGRHAAAASLRPMELDTLYGGSGLSARTVWICHTVVRQSLEQARKWGLIARSPAVDATPPPQTRSAVTPPTVAELPGTGASRTSTDSSPRTSMTGRSERSVGATFRVWRPVGATPLGSWRSTS
jgi:hypothetical protein